MMTLKHERELETKGYMLKICDSESEAREKVRWYHENGYRARFAEYSTRIAGWHHYAVWYKAK